MGYQRNVKTQLDRHKKGGANYPTAYIAAHPQTAIIISGQEDIVTNLRHFLPP